MPWGLRHQVPVEFEARPMCRTAAVQGLSSAGCENTTTRQLNNYWAHRPLNRTTHNRKQLPLSLKARCSGPTPNMPVPFETLLPYAIMIGVRKCFGLLSINRLGRLLTEGFRCSASLEPDLPLSRRGVTKASDHDTH